MGAALKSIFQLHSADVCVKIKTPVFFAIAGKDIVVDNDGTQLTASLLPHCKTMFYSTSEHQIHRECDDIRDKFNRDMMAYIQKYLPT